MERDWKAYALKLEAALREIAVLPHRGEYLRDTSKLACSPMQNAAVYALGAKINSIVTALSEEKPNPWILCKHDSLKSDCLECSDFGEAARSNIAEPAPTTEAAPSEYDIALFRKYEDAAVQNADLTLRLANAIALSDARLGGGTKLMAENAELKRQLAAAQSRVDAAEFRAEKAIALLREWAEASWDVGLTLEFEGRVFAFLKEQG